VDQKVRDHPRQTLVSQAKKDAPAIVEVEEVRKVPKKATEFSSPRFE